MFLGLPSTISIRDRKVMCDMHIRYVCLGHMAVEYVVQNGFGGVGASSRSKYSLLDPSNE